VERADPRDVERFRTLFEAHWTAVERYARRRVEAHSSADVAAEVFAIAWRRRADLPVDVLPWLYGVARRVVSNHRRAARRAAQLVDRLGAALPSADAPPLDDLGSSERVLETLAFETAFKRLSEGDQEVLALITWEGLDARRAAVALGCSVGAVTMRITRARRRLRRLLEEGSEP
jgi:RNA polymerase sigma-70 factor (ECF subfamily)